MLSTQNGRAWTIFTVIDQRSGAWILQTPARYLCEPKVKRLRLRLALQHRGAKVYVHQRQRRDRGEWKMQGWQLRIGSEVAR
jgi:hypothetical protein